MERWRKQTETDERKPLVIPARPVYTPRPLPPARRTPLGLSPFLGLFTIHADGRVEVSVVQSTGHEAWDQRALEAARRWRFHPATMDGRFVDSYLRLRVEFE